MHSNYLLWDRYYIGILQSVNINRSSVSVLVQTAVENTMRGRLYVSSPCNSISNYDDDDDGGDDDSRTVAFSPISLDSSSPSSATARTCVPCTSQRCELHRSDPLAISTHRWYDDGGWVWSWWWLSMIMINTSMMVVEYDHDQHIDDGGWVWSWSTHRW